MVGIKSFTCANVRVTRREEEWTVVIPRVSFEESLWKDVVLAGKCTGCAGCVVSCPIKVLGYAEERPRLIGKCTSCGICAQICPRYEKSLSSVDALVFGRKTKPEEDFGIYRRVLVARATDAHVLRVCQDGGVVTALLVFALENGLIDGAAVSGLNQEKPFYPVPKLALTSQEVLECAGTRYSYSPNLLALREGIKLKKESLAFVGTPCQIQALRRMEMLPLKKYAKALNFSIGLLCSESFTYEGLMEKQIRGVLGVDLRGVEKINIKGKVLVTTKSGEDTAIPLKEAKQYAQKGCSLCPDFSAELADISTGGVGLKDWTLTIIRTRKGEELFKQAENKGVIETKPVEHEKKALDILINLSSRKHGRILA